MSTRDTIRIANCSAFYGDRLSAAKEMVEGGPIDVLTGDWLAELTMLILVRDRMSKPELGYARTFVKQLQQVLGTCLERGIRIVANAGGANPEALVSRLESLAADAGLSPTIACVTGDDVTARLEDWSSAGTLTHMQTGEKWTPDHGQPVAAHAYLGAKPIRAALEAGADIVITGRSTDAAPILAAAAWAHGWRETDWDRLAGALVAGHVIECGTQATGGNYAWYDEIALLDDIGFPLAEIAADGTSVITKHPGTGGRVDTGTVTAQLLYEIGGPNYLSPDVVAYLDTVCLESAGPDRVRIHGVRGGPPPATAKVGVQLLAGFRNRVTFLIGGADGARKAELLARQFWDRVGIEGFVARDTRFEPVALDAVAPAHRISRLTVSARAASADRMGRAFTGPAVELALASIPGLTLERPPEKPSPCGLFWPVAVPWSALDVHVRCRGETVAIPPPTATATSWDRAVDTPRPMAPPATGDTRTVPLGTLVGARSGDKAGDANVGFWVRDEAHVAWLLDTITEPTLRAWLPDFDGEIEVHALPGLLAVNTVLRGYLGHGVGSSIALDAQAKCLAEALRTVDVQVDASLLPSETPVSSFAT